MSSTMALVLLLALQACKQDEVFFQYRMFHNSEWAKDEAAAFLLDSLSVTENESYDVFLEITNTSRCSNKNLWLQIEQNITDSTLVTDTVEVALADRFGKWRGVGYGSMFQLSDLYRKNVHLQRDSTYFIRINQMMQGGSVSGIERIGVRVQRHDLRHERNTKFVNIFNN